MIQKLKTDSRIRIKIGFMILIIDSLYTYQLIYIHSCPFFKAEESYTLIKSVFSLGLMACKKQVKRKCDKN